MLNEFVSFRNFVLIHAVRPYIVPFAFEEQNFAGETVQITCFIAKGESPLQIFWDFHGEEPSSQLGMSTSRIGERMSILIIESLMSMHTGNYTCRAENRAGQTNFTAELVVSG